MTVPADNGVEPLRLSFEARLAFKELYFRIITDHTAQPITDFPGGAVGGKTKTQTRSANCQSTNSR